MKTVAVVNRSNNYNLIDFNHLESKGIDAIPIITGDDKGSYKNSCSVQSLTYSNLLTAMKNIKPEYICCMYDGLMIDMAKIRQNLELPGLHEDEASSLIDKNRVYERISSVVKIPNTVILNDKIDFLTLVNLLKTESIFIKPYDKLGSDSIFLVNNKYDFLKFLAEKKYSLDTYLAQEYIEGKFFHVELIVQYGKVNYISARKYSSPNHRMMTDSIPLFSIDINNEETSSLLEEAAVKVQQRLNFNNGIMHMEFYLKEDNHPIFIESNIRYPGIWINKMYRKKLGLSLETLMILIEANIKLESICSDSNYYVCGYYPILEGTVRKINSLILPISYELEVVVKRGQYYERPTMLSKAAAILAWDTDFDKVFKEYKELRKFKIIETE